MAVLFTPGDVAPADAAQKVQGGLLRQITDGVFTDDLNRDLPDIVGDHIYQIVAHLLPGAVITGRTAITGEPTNTGDHRTLYVTHHDRQQNLQLPGHTVAVQRGSGPIEGDQTFICNGLFLASQARALLDNARPTSSEQPTRSLSRKELEQHIDRLASHYSPERLSRLQTQVKQVGDTLGDPNLAAEVAELLAAAQGARRNVQLSTPALAARRDGMPVDRRRLELFDVLTEKLRSHTPEPPNTTHSGAAAPKMLPFYEAYFTNFIEGIKFTIDEATTIIYEGHVPDGRTSDAHDLLGTYHIVADDTLMSAPAPTPEQLLHTLQKHHTTIMSHRTDKNPGRFKTVNNRAGATEFVRPTEVIGTLQAGWERVRTLDEPFARAVLAMFVVAEVHPFDDGNGRVARIMMNTELVAADQARIIIPPVFRNNYLSALRAMTANTNPDALIAVLSFAQRWTAQSDWSSIEAANADLERTNALWNATAAEQKDIRLQLP